MTLRKICGACFGKLATSECKCTDAPAPTATAKPKATKKAKPPKRGKAIRRRKIWRDPDDDMVVERLTSVIAEASMHRFVARQNGDRTEEIHGDEVIRRTLAQLQLALAPEVNPSWAD